MKHPSVACFKEAQKPQGLCTARLITDDVELDSEEDDDDDDDDGDELAELEVHDDEPLLATAAAAW